MKKYLILILMLVPALVFSESGPNWKVLVFQAKLKKKNPLSIEFHPPKQHHFNAEAPSKVELNASGLTTVVAEITKTTSLVTADFPMTVSGAKDCKISAQLYLCDDKNSYCVPVQEEFRCEKLSEAKVISLVPGDKAAPKEKLEDKPGELANFIMNDQVTAFKEASQNHKMLLIDFFGIWCPPCNMLDETVFNRADFQNRNKDYEFLKMDADNPQSFALKSKYQVTGYPTVILANSQGEEITRIVGYRKKAMFLNEMHKAWALRNSSVSARQAQADSGKSPQAALSLAEMYFNQENYLQALKYLNLSYGAKDLELQKKLSIGIQVGLFKENAKDNDSKKKAAGVLETWIKANAGSVESLDWSDYLGQLAEDVKDEGLKKRNRDSIIKIAEDFIGRLHKNPGLLDDQEITEADLYAILADAEEAVDAKKSQADYLSAAAAYENEIKKSGIAMEKERGNNLERAYCLYKGGKVDEALKLYEHLEEVYSKEFTFYFAHASVLQKLGQEQKALVSGKQALQYSYGDNQLRATFLVAELEVKLGQKKEALDLVNETLAKNPLDKNLKVRSSRYVDKLVQLKSQL